MEATEHIYSVSELNLEARSLLEGCYTNIAIEGEISNLATPGSGHWYFTLKDSRAQIRCAMFRMHNQRLDFHPENGMQILVQAKVSIYPDRGDYQLIVNGMHEIGAGALQRKFEQLKKQLQSEGLFEECHKQMVPKMPQCIGIISSSTGAALHDILSVLKRRYSLANVIIYPTSVQGERSVKEIVNAINIANQRAECDILIVARGGGSLEDLWSFNEEIVARAIFASKLPIISGIGHEVDFTIADFVADFRAPTPSVAAEKATPDKQELLATFNHYALQLSQQCQQLIKQRQQEHQSLYKRLVQCHPQQQLQQQQQKLDWLHNNLNRAMADSLKQTQQQFSLLTEKLNALNPLTTLSRGYAFVTNNDGQIITSTKQVAGKDTIHARLVDGELICIVNKVNVISTNH